MTNNEKANIAETQARARMLNAQAEEIELRNAVTKASAANKVGGQQS